MTSPAVREDPSVLEATLLEVQATVAELLVAAHEQHAALVAHDRERLEGVTRRQEGLSAQLARAESRRLELLGGAQLRDKIAELPTRDSLRLSQLTRSIGRTVAALRERQAATASVLEHSIDLAGQTLTFLHRLVSTETPTYGAHGLTAARQSVLVDGRA